jgi:2-amino-4-hydroxy-6-hydroxymethyldihydropteridine diphosphokinase
MKSGRWPVAVGRWPLAGGRWPVAVGRWPLAGGRWPVAVGRWPLAGGRWPVAGGRWPVANTQWLGQWVMTTGFHEASMVGVVLQVMGRRFNSTYPATVKIEHKLRRRG